MSSQDRKVLSRNTRQRNAIREVFQNSDGPLGPEEVMAAAQKLADGIGIATVYRTIKAFVEEGWLVAVPLPGMPPRYEVSGKAHHHHFQCDQCGTLFEVEGCVNTTAMKVPRGFKVTGHEIMLYGQCAECGRQVKQA